MARVPFRHVIGEWRGSQHPFRDDRLIVSVKEGVPVESTLGEVAQALSSQFLRSSLEVTHYDGRPWAIFKFPPLPDAAIRLPQIAEQIAADRRILYAEPSFIGHSALEPSAAEGEWGEEEWATWIGLPEAWDNTTGSSEVLLAIMDSGISITPGGTTTDHPDLSDARYIITSGVNHDFVEGDSVPQDDHPEGHGTHVTGIAAAAGDNATGMAGVNWVSSVYVARVLTASDNWDTGSLKDAVHNAITYAASVLKVDRVVINISLHINTDADHFVEMFDEAPTLGPKVLICCSAKVMGMSRTDLEYPAAYAKDYDFILVVASTNGGDDAALDTIAEPLGMYNYDAVGIFAPGVGIHSTLPTYKRGASGSAAETNYGDRTGTSMATPMVAGVASLMWGLNKKLTAAQLIECMQNMADTLNYTRKEDDGTGTIVSSADTHFRLNAAQAVEAAKWSIQLKEEHVIFSDVPPGTPNERTVEFGIEHCDHELDFELVAGSDGAFPGSLKVFPTSGHYVPDATGAGNVHDIKVTYTPPAAGDIAYGEFRIKCRETAQEWTLHITASAAVADGTGVVLVADRSGSMDEDSGITSGAEELSRMAVLLESASILVDTLRVGDGLGVVGFSSDVDVPSPYGDIEATTDRNDIKAKIATMSPGGATSIGGGVQEGLAVISGASQTHRTMIVLTDGKENTAPYVDAVIGTVDVKTYAIGMGTSEVLQPDALQLLAAETGGYLLLTDVMDDTARYRVAKYILQMLTEADSGSMVLDPSGTLQPGQQISIPFDLCTDDRTCEVILMTPAPRLVRMAVIAPDGKELREGAGVRRVRGSHVLVDRFAIPRGRGGTWKATISLAEERPEHGVRRRRVPYHLIVTSRSEIHMEVRANANSSQPGATVVLRATVSRRGAPWVGHLRASAVVRKRDREFATVALEPTGQGVFEGSFVATETGVYECLVRATGLMDNGERFSREQTVTAHTWQPDANPTDLDHARNEERDRKKRKPPRV